MMTFYVICLMVGLIFSVLSFILSGGFEAHIDRRGRPRLR